MNAEQFRKSAYQMVDYVADYLENVEKKHDVYPNVDPGFMRELMPDTAPQEGEKWETIFAEFEQFVIPGVTHWQSPHFHAYFPATSSYPSILGDILSATLNNIGFTWKSSPSTTELETIVLDWLGKMLELPKEFLAFSQTNDHKSYGGGAIQGTAGEAGLVAIISARDAAIERAKIKYPDLDKFALMRKLVAYQSDQTHLVFVKGCRIAGVELRSLETGESNALRGEVLDKAIKEDNENGNIPFFLCATLGTTSTCAFDNLKELGPICQKHNIWMHIDAAYAGSAFMCPEFRPLLDGVEFAESFNINCHKLMMVNFDCSPLWVKDRNKVVSALNCDYIMFTKELEGLVTDYKDLQIPLGRRFRALKLWFVLRTYGVKGLQDHIRKHVQLAKCFETMVSNDDRFELLGCQLGLVTFRLKGSNEINDALNKEVNDTKKIYMTPTFVKGKRILRFAVSSPRTTEDHVKFAWDLIQTNANKVIHTFDNAE